MRLVELRQIQSLIQSLSDSTDISVECAAGRLDITGRNSPYASNTEVTFSPAYAGSALKRFEFHPYYGAELNKVIFIENDRFGLLANAEPDQFAGPKPGCEHQELAHGVLPRRTVSAVLESIPGAYMLGIELLALVPVVWARPRVVGWWPNGDPIFAAELTGDLESLRGHRMTHLRFRDDRPTITLPDETEFVVHAYSIVNFHVLAYGENEGERTLALLPVEDLDTVVLHRNDPDDASQGYNALATWRGFESHLQLDGVKTWNL
jgi:hypothetical protein